MENLQVVVYNSGIMTLKPVSKVSLSALCKDLREAFKYTQSEMATRLGVTLKPYQKWEYGISDPSGEFAAKLFLLREELQEKHSIIVPLKFIK